jgi:hypothetical protein
MLILPSQNLVNIGLQCNDANVKMRFYQPSDFGDDSYPVDLNFQLKAQYNFRSLINSRINCLNFSYPVSDSNAAIGTDRNRSYFV